MATQIQKIWNTYLRVPEQDPAKTSRARAQLTLFLLLSIVDLLRLVHTLTVLYRAEWLVLELLTLGLLTLLAFFTRRGHAWPGYILLGFLLFMVPYTFREHINTPLVLAYAIPITIAPFVAAPWLALVVAVIEALSLYMVGLALAYPPFDPLAYLLLLVAGAVVWLSSAGFQNALAVARQKMHDLGRINAEFEAGRTATAERAAALDRRAAYLRATAEVAQDAAAASDLDTLLQRIVNLISRRLDFYHAAIYLTAEGDQWTVLRAASSEEGRRLLDRGHRLAVNSETLVGSAARHGEPGLLLDVESQPAAYARDEFPATRSLVALPLRVRNDIVGVLDLHSRKTAALAAEDLRALQSLADQVALSLGNARLFLQAEERMEAARRAYAALGGHAWEERLRGAPVMGYRSTRSGVNPLSPADLDPAGEALRPAQNPQPAAGGDAEKHCLTVPIKVGGQIIGMIDTYKPASAGGWTAEERSLLETLSEQLGTALESARLYHDSQRRATREQLTREVSERLQRATDMEGLLRTTVEELNRVLGASHTYIRMGTESELAGPPAPVDPSEA